MAQRWSEVSISHYMFLNDPWNADTFKKGYRTTIDCPNVAVIMKIPYMLLSPENQVVKILNSESELCDLKLVCII